MTIILSNADVADLLTMPECIDALEDAYRELAQGRGVNRRCSDTFAPTVRKDALYSLKTMGYQFAAGAIVYQKAKKQRYGRNFPTEWLTQDAHP